jgi:hypothetical protein
MRVKTLIASLDELVEELKVEGWKEFRTPDKTRIDYGITRGSQRLLSVEFERSRKWLFARVLYNAVKAQRAEFPAILFVYPFYDLPRAGRSWVPTYVEDELGLRLALCHPRDCIPATRTLICEQLQLPIPDNVVERNCVITTTAPPSLKVGAEAWKSMKASTSGKQKKQSRTKKTQKKKSTRNPS